MSIITDLGVIPKQIYRLFLAFENLFLIDLFLASWFSLIFNMGVKMTNTISCSCSKIKLLDANLVKEFESQIQADQKICCLWGDVKPFFNHAIVNTFGEASQIFSKVLKLTQNLPKDEKLKNVWIKLLQQGEFHHQLTAQNTHTYCFDSITKLVEKGQKDFNIQIVEVDQSCDDIKEIANEIHQIYTKVEFSVSNDLAFLEKVLSVPNTACLLAKHEDITIGSLVAEYVTIRRTNNQRVNVLFFMFLCRRAEYPSVYLMKQLSESQGKLERFKDVDYLSLCVVQSNLHAIEIYKTVGFSDFDPVISTNGQPLFYSTKKVEGSNVDEKPTHPEVVAALDEQEN